MFHYVLSLLDIFFWRKQWGVVGIRTMLGAGRFGVRIQKKFRSLPGPTQPPVQRVLFRRSSGRGVKLITSFHLLPRLRISETMYLFPLICLHSVHSKTFTSILFSEKYFLWDREGNCVYLLACSLVTLSWKLIWPPCICIFKFLVMYHNNSEPLPTRWK
jgi:hypothetical protein